MGPELQKYTEETENYREFLKLCNEVVRLNEQICELRPTREIKDETELEELKKLKETLYEEIQKEVDQIVSSAFKGKDKLGHMDIESLEMRIRSSMHGIGSIMLEKLLNTDGGDYRGNSIACDNGHMYEFMGYRDKELLTVLGEVKIKRAYYYDRQCNEGFCPKDSALDIEGTSFSGVRRMVGRVGAHRAFGLGHEDIKELAGIDVNAKEVERISEQLGTEAEGFFKKQAEASLSEKVIPMMKPIPKMYVCMDGTGVPVIKAETVGRGG